jgi:filamentous hemagglutinin family protein
MKAPLVLWLLIVPIGLLLQSHRAWSQSYQPSERVPIADRTLGTTVSGSNGNFTIDGGVTRGPYLFHSFQDFSVPTNGSATFANPAGNQSTIARVTGLSISDINGTINTQGANFFLINPNGIVFGPQTQLNVGSIFAASTANGLELGNVSGQTISFDRQGSGDAALLRVNPLVLFDPTRLNFGGEAGAIRNFGNLQTSNSNQYIGLIGGNVSIEGGQINAPGGRVEVGGLSALGTVEFRIDRNARKLLFPAGVARSDVSIQDNAVINVAGSQGGEIEITARNLQVSSSSRLRGGVEPNQGQANNISGNIEIDAANNILIDKDAILVNNVRANAQGQSGKLILRAGNNISIQDNSLLQNVSLGLGDAGLIDITAGNVVSISGMGTSILGGTAASGIGNSGNINITAGSFSLTAGGFISPFGSGQNSAGSVSITARDTILITGQSTSIFTGSQQGNGGDISLSAGRSLSVADGGVLQSSSRSGVGGTIRLAAQDNISISGTQVTTSPIAGQGSSGAIHVQSNNLLLDGATLVSANFAQGNGGDISISTQYLRLFNGSSILSSVDSSSGRAGNIQIHSGSLVLQDFSSIGSTSDNGPGTAGNIAVTATDKLVLQDFSILATRAFAIDGTAGNISITSPQVTLDRSGLTSRAVSGMGGDIEIAASDRLLLRNQSFITTNSGQDGGNINIDAQLITAIPLENSDITANAINGRGGIINIRSQGLFGITPQPRRTNRSEITASSDINLNGEIRINTPGIDPVKKTNELPTVPIDASQQIAQTCSPQQTNNNLYLTGRGGHPPNATEPGNSDVVWVDPRTPQPTKPQTPTTPVLANTIRPAVGWSIDAQGQVSLLAAQAAPAIPKTPATCPTH